MTNQIKSYIGYWWLPEEEDKKIQGTLTVNNNGKYTLKVLNSLGSYSEKELVGIDQIELIIGIAIEEVTNNSYCFKLIDSFRSGFSISGLTSYEFSARKVLKSVFQEFSTDLKFDFLSLRPACIDNWFNCLGYELSYPEDRKVGLHNFQLNYKSPKTKVLYECEEFQIESCFQVSYNGPIHNFKTEQKANLTIQYNFQKDLSEILNDSRIIRNFFTLATGKPIHYEDISLSKSFSKNGKLHNKYFSYHEISKFDNIEDDDNIPNSNSMLFAFKHIENESQKVFQNWFEKYDSLKFLMNNYFSTLYNQFLFSEDRFLNYVFALEVYHKINNSSSKNFRLNSRVEQLLKENENLLEGLVHDIERLTNQIVETRHHFVHDKVLNPQYVVKDVKRLNKLGSLLKVLIQVILLKEIGLSLDLIKERINKPIMNKLIFHNSRKI